MSRYLKKISYKYEFLKLELEETEEELDSYLSEWNKHFGKYFVQKESEMWVNEETGELRKDLPEEDLEKPKKKQKPEKLKKLYKKLSTFTHPDKGGKVDDFNAVKEAYQKENLLELLKFAGLYDIDFDLEEEDESLVNKTFTNIQEEIQGHKGNMAWAFGTGDKAKKLAVIKMLEDKLGIEIKKEDYPKELLDLI